MSAILCRFNLSITTTNGKLDMEPYRNFRHLEKLSGVTWRDLIALEPALEELLETARETSAICRRPADVDRFFVPIGNELAGLVGLTGKNHRHPVLGSTKAYEIAYWKLYDAVVGSLPARSGGAEAIRAARKFFVHGDGGGMEFKFDWTPRGEDVIPVDSRGQAARPNAEGPEGKRAREGTLQRASCSPECA
jgi:hypothetical protein